MRSNRLISFKEDRVTNIALGINDNSGYTTPKAVAEYVDGKTYIITGTIDFRNSTITTETTYKDIKTAVEAGRTVILRATSGPIDTYVCPLVNFELDFAMFTVTVNTSVWLFSCFNTDKWIFSRSEHESTSNKVMFIDDNSSDQQYPTARAVVDYVDKVVGDTTVSDFIVNISVDEDGVITSDKAYSKIFTAHSNGKIVSVYLSYSDEVSLGTPQKSVLSLVQCGNDKAVFSNISAIDENACEAITLTVEAQLEDDDADVWSITTTQIPSENMITDIVETKVESVFDDINTNFESIGAAMNTLGQVLRYTFHVNGGCYVYRERVSNGTYIKIAKEGSITDGTVRRLTCDGTTKQLSWATDIIPKFTGTVQTSEAGVENCIYFTNAQTLYYDVENDRYVMNGASTVKDVSKFVPILWCYYGTFGGMLVESDIIRCLNYANTIEKNVNSELMIRESPGLDDGVKAFLSLYANVGATFEPFMFFTDPHLYDKFGTANDNVMHRNHWIKYLHKVYNSLPLSCVICGGDWQNSTETVEDTLNVLGIVKGIMSNMFTNAHLCVGNHDTNWLKTNATLTSEQIARLWNPQIGKCYYGFLGYNTKFYILDTRADGSDSVYTKEQLTWLCNELQTNNDSNIAIAMHIMFTDNAHTQLSHMGQKLSEIITAYNAKTTYTFESTTYNFSNATGKIRFTMAGHTHKQDEQIVGGVPCILLNKVSGNDIYTSRCAGMLADYDNNKLHIVAFGDMESKTIDI